MAAATRALPWDIAAFTGHQGELARLGDRPPRPPRPKGCTHPGGLASAPAVTSWPAGSPFPATLREWREIWGHWLLPLMFYAGLQWTCTGP